LEVVFQDTVGKMQWKCCAFVGDDFVIGGYAEKAEHKIFFFSRQFGQIATTIEGQHESVLGLAWHPSLNVVLSYSSVGVLYVWGRQGSENWSAYAPGFRELEENEEYVEREDEFDQPNEAELRATKKSEEDNQDTRVSISSESKNDLISDDFEPDFIIPSAPIPEAFYLPEAFKSPLILAAGAKGKRRKLGV
jgi:COMPASS component SWD1